MEHCVLSTPSDSPSLCELQASKATELVASMNVEEMLNVWQVWSTVGTLHGEMPADSVDSVDWTDTRCCRVA